jgi:uncharacterized SAM-binding protein YcdF (DUF218 family)
LRVLVLLLSLAWLIANSGKFLVVDEPQHADAILVLAGETDHRPARALELLSQEYAPRIVLDVPADAMVFGSSLLQVAQNWANAQPQSKAISICPIHGLSTKAEALEAAQCLHNVGARSVLIVTSDFHTRRALSEFHKEAPDFTFHVAAAYDREQFGTLWWQHRQWAKINFDEWLRLLWWEFVAGASIWRIRRGQTLSSVQASKARRKIENCSRTRTLKSAARLTIRNSQNTVHR